MLTAILNPTPLSQKQGIYEQVDKVVTDLPTDIARLITDYAVVDISAVLKLGQDHSDINVDLAFKDIFTSLKNSQLKSYLLSLAMKNECTEKVADLLAEALSNGKDVYLNCLWVERICTAIFRRKDFSDQSAPVPNYGKVHFTAANIITVMDTYLPGANFQHIRLDHCSGCNAFLYGADFSYAEVTDCFFSECTNSPDNADSDPDMAGKTNLSYALFVAANVDRSDFKGAIMVGANFTGAMNLTSACFENTELSSIIFFDADISKKIQKLGYSTDHSKWVQIFVQAYGKMPECRQLDQFSMRLAKCNTDLLLKYADEIPKLKEDEFAKLVEFSAQPGGGDYGKNIWLISQGIFPAELSSYNRYRSEGHSEDEAAKMVRQEWLLP